MEIGVVKIGPAKFRTMKIGPVKIGVGANRRRRGRHP